MKLFYIVSESLPEIVISNSDGQVIFSFKTVIEDDSPSPKTTYIVLDEQYEAIKTGVLGTHGEAVVFKEIENTVGAYQSLIGAPVMGDPFGEDLQDTKSWENIVNGLKQSGRFGCRLALVGGFGVTSNPSKALVCSSVLSRATENIIQAGLRVSLTCYAGANERSSRHIVDHLPVVGDFDSFPVRAYDFRRFDGVWISDECNRASSDIYPGLTAHEMYSQAFGVNNHGYKTRFLLHQDAHEAVISSLQEISTGGTKTLLIYAPDLDKSITDQIRQNFLKEFAEPVVIHYNSVSDGSDGIEGTVFSKSKVFDGDYELNREGYSWMSSQVAEADIFVTTDHMAAHIGGSFGVPTIFMASDDGEYSDHRYYPTVNFIRVSSRDSENKKLFSDHLAKSIRSAKLYLDQDQVSVKSDSKDSSFGGKFSVILKALIISVLAASTGVAGAYFFGAG